MRDSRLVRLGQAFRNLRRDFNRLSNGQQAREKQFAQRLPLNQFHRDKGAAIALVDLMDRADIRMIQRGGKARLAGQTAERLRVLDEFFGKKLQRNMAAELQVFGFVNHAHAAAADLAKNAVVADHGCGQPRFWI